jgi:hypothetical integral membrane protein (TIGR02206 family)
MEHVFGSEFYGDGLTLLDSIHIITMLSILAFNILLFIFLKKIDVSLAKKYFPKIFASFMLILDIIFNLWIVSTGGWSVSCSLPLHLCDLSIILSIVLLFNKNYFLFEIIYFWGLAGSLQAIITPDLYPYNFPHIKFWAFFVLHGAIITTIFYMVLIEKYRPTFKSIWKALIAVNLYAVPIMILNMTTGGNYLYIAHKPQSVTIIDYLGPWPWYILSLEFIGVISFLLCYSPYAIADLTKNKQSGNISV